MAAYYNEHDPFAAAWLRELIAADLIAPGEVDERDIQDVTPDELRPFRQCHFFAGIGVWSYALRKAGWPDEAQIWTGSCPCQPFSTAGKGDGFADERHLWPAFFHLIQQCRPPIILGEQVTSKDGLAWLDLVSSDMEAAGHAFGAADLCAAGFGAPHIRQRIYWLAYTDSAKREAHYAVAGCHGEGCEGRSDPVRGGHVRGLGDTNRQSQRRGPGPQGGASGQDEGEMGGRVGQRLRPVDGGASAAGWLANPERGGREGGQLGRGEPRTVQFAEDLHAIAARATNGFWRSADWCLCRDPDGPKWRAVEPGTFPLAHGPTARLGRVRGYGNAINAEVAAGFIEAVMDVLAAEERLAA
jgi:DNA (cytosine-5)-methyltransferase 1